MGLQKYSAKRHFDKTPEPQGHTKRSKAKKLIFVVQEHHASRLHYDVRLELDGVLKSWAVPKGPSMNPHDHHLAIQVEDHPYEYRTFEDVIPEGNYGAGNVIIWDEGTYQPYHDGPDDQATVRKELKKGHLTFFLFGKKLRGEFALIQMHGKDDKNWLLIKKGDETASTTNILTQDTSVKSGKKVDELGSPSHVDDRLSSYPAKKHPWTVHPMLCTLVDKPFNGSEWLFEIKWDGYRAVAGKDGDDIQLYSRTQNDFRAHYPPIVEAIRSLQHDVILDGEIMVVDSDGIPHFELLQHWRHDPQGHLLYYVFDILWCDGRDVRDMPLIQRKKLLKSILPTRSIIRYSDHVETEGVRLFEQVRQKNLEGIVAKKADSTYKENDRGAAWLKIKTGLRQEVVIGGFTEPRGSREYLGSLLVGVYDRGKLVYTGHSGGGISDIQRQQLRAQLDKLEQKQSPFSTQPKPNAPVHWVRPTLVIEMGFTEWTSDGHMRHPAFKGMRPDKNPHDVHREKPKKLRKKKA